MLKRSIYSIRKVLAYIIRIPESLILLLELTIDPDISMTTVKYKMKTIIESMRDSF